MTGTSLSVLQAAAWYPPFSLGGTEVYLEGLVGELADLGIESTILVPRNAEAPERYEHVGTGVETYPVNEAPAPDEMKGGRPHLDFEVFRALLAKNRSAIYHQHSWTRGCGLHHLRAARELGLRTVLTIHVPSNICMRGSMIRFGEGPCDGLVDEKICGACWAQGRGAPKLVARTIANLPLVMATCARHGETRLATALSARALAAERLDHIAEMIGNSDRIVAVCEWLYAALTANGVPAHKLILSRQGVTREYLHAARAISRTSRRAAPMQLLFLGRWDAEKGIDVAVRAIRSLAVNIPIHLSIRAIPALRHECGYETSVRAMAGSDARISFDAPIPRSKLASVMADYDVLVVPSLWLETGPLVVLEAQAAGLFVLGSRLGGIAELVDDGNDGELVEAGNVSAWARAIEWLASKYAHGLWPSCHRSVRTMSEAAAEMADLYGSLQLQ